MIVHVLLSAVSAPLVITPSAVTAVITAVVGWYLQRRVGEVHVLVNARLTDALTEIKELQVLLSAAEKAPPAVPPVG